MELIREVGAFAGLAAFVGLAVLALLYFSQARDVRRLRENAEFLVEGEGPLPSERAAGEPVPAAVAGEEPAEAARAAAATAPNEAEAFRRAELARQAAERRQRFEQRRQDGGPRSWFGDVPSTAVIVVGALILLAGIGFGATRLLDGDEDTGGGAGGGQKRACSPISTKVAVLNGTAEAGLAANYARQLEQAGYERGPVTNTESAFESSVIMFAQGKQSCAPEVATTAGLPDAPSEAMSQEIVGIAEGSAVAVVLGEDVATGEPSASDSTTEESADTLGG